MHSVGVVVPCLRVNLPDREWLLDLPELTSIQLGWSAFEFKEDDDSTELIMRSGDDKTNWWIDLPRLTTLTTKKKNSNTFCNPHSIILEGFSYYSIIINRHALSHHRVSEQVVFFQLQENRPHQEFPLFLPLTLRHHSRSPTLPLLSSFFHTQFIISTHI